MDSQFEQNARPSDDTEIERLCRLSLFEYDRGRKGAAERLGVSVATLDAEVNKRRKEDSAGNPGAGRELTFPEVEPWPGPVDGSILLSELSETIGRFVYMDKNALDATALWDVMTWLHDRLRIAPFLNITSATKRCGKSTLVDVLSRLAFRPMPVSGQVTSAALFRTIELYEPTLLLDELDTYFKDDPDLRGIINGSQRKSGAFTVRCVGDDHEPRRFSTWCPKALVGIGGLPDTVTDRSIVVRLDRRPQGQGGINFRDRDKAHFDALRRQIQRWTDDNAEAVASQLRRTPFPDGLDDRARDSWECLLSIASVAGGDWPDRALKACSALNATRQGVESAKELLLADIRDVFADKGNPPSIESEEILVELNGMEHRPWCEWSHGKVMTARGLATQLRGFGIAPGTIRLASPSPRTGRLHAKGYKLETFEKAWSLYLPGDLSVTRLQPAEILEKPEFLSVTPRTDVTDTDSPKPAEIKACNRVTDTEPPRAETVEEFGL